MKKIQIIFVVLLSVIIAFPILNKKFNWLKEINYENKTPSPLPQFNIHFLDPFPDSMHNYFSDNFGLRNNYMRTYGIAMAKLFHKSPVPDMVYFGKNGYMYATHAELGTYDGSLRFDKNKLDSFYAVFNFRAKEYKKMGVKFYLVIVPVKQSVYPEFQPQFIQNIASKTTRTDDVINAIKNIDNLEIIDLRKQFNKIKKQSAFPIYYKTDNHFNYIGGYYCGKIISEIVGKNKVYYPTITAWDSTKKISGNLAYFSALRGILEETEYFPIAPGNDILNGDTFEIPRPLFSNSWEYQWSKKCEKSTGKIFIIRDSYGFYYLPFLSNSFNYTYSIFDQWHYGHNLKLVEKYKPNSVVLEIVENHLDNILVYNFTE